MASQIVFHISPLLLLLLLPSFICAISLSNSSTFSLSLSRHTFSPSVDLHPPPIPVCDHLHSSLLLLVCSLLHETKVNMSAAGKLCQNVYRDYKTQEAQRRHGLLPCLCVVSRRGTLKKERVIESLCGLSSRLLARFSPVSVYIGVWLCFCVCV